MFYEPKDGHGLPHNPFNAVVTRVRLVGFQPEERMGRRTWRPIRFSMRGLRAAAGDVCLDRGQGGSREGQGLGREHHRHGRLLREHREYAMRDKMNITSEAFPREVDEFERADLERAGVPNNSVVRAWQLHRPIWNASW